MTHTDNGIFRMMDDFSVDHYKLKQKFCPDNNTFIIRASSQIDRIFTELYDLPENVRKTYFKIKIMELFLFLENLDVPEGGEERSYFYKTQVDKVKEMVKLQTEDLSRWYTLEELSRKFAGAFKSKMGMTPSAYRNTLTK